MIELDSPRAAIAAIDCFPVRMRLHKPLRMATYELTDAPVLFVRVTTADGAQGWGEAAANMRLAGETLRGMVACMDEHLRPAVLDTGLVDRVQTMDRVRASTHGNRGVIAALDMALLDLAGQVLQVPAVELLGGRRRDAVPVLRLVGGSGSTSCDVEETVEFHRRGYRAFKLKVGVQPLDAEIAMVRKLREQLGSETLIGVDANMGWSMAACKRFLDGVADCEVSFIEQPFAPAGIDLLSRLAAASLVPLAIDESLCDVQDMMAHHGRRAISGVSLKSIKLGGPLPVACTARLASALGLSTNIAMMMESSLATAAMVHVASAVPDIEWGLSLGNEWLADEPFSQGPVARDGQVACPGGPGLGFRPDEALLRELAC